MVKVLDANKFSTRLIDRSTWASLVPQKVIEITEHCPGLKERERAILIYTQDSDGRMVQMLKTYPGSETLGAETNFHFDSLRYFSPAPSRDTAFGWWANRVGLPNDVLRNFILNHAPAG
ncbi:MAG: hypothetical protein P4L53_23625 [Candidatus Obscuribacterales bacterium]|nr:hypothetical protein [Candidatus Obscuribacterales bacterium]